MLETIYFRSIKIIIFLVPVIPLIVSRSFIFPWIEGKNYAFRILIELASVFWIGLMVLHKEYRPRNSAIFISVLAFTFIIGLADILGVNPYKSFWSSYERMEGYVTILHLALYFMIIRTVFRSQKDWFIFLNIFFIIGAVVVSNAIFKEFFTAWGAYRAFGTLGNAPFLASYLLLIIFIGLILLFNTNRVGLRILYILFILLHSLGIYYSATRGAILAALFGVVFFSLLYMFNKITTGKERVYRKIALAAITVSIIIPIFFIKFYERPEVPNNFMEFQDTLPRFITATVDSSISSRLDAWKVAWEGIKQRPLLGWGQENFISLYAISPVPYGEQIFMDRAHNIFLDWMVNAGLIGVLSYISIFISAFYIIRKSYKDKLIEKHEAVMLAAALLVYVSQNMFVFDTTVSYLLFFTLLAYIDSIPERNEVNITRDGKSEKLKKRFVVVVLIAALGITYVSYYINYRPLRESLMTNDIVIKFKEDKYRSFRTVSGDFKKALSLNTFGNTEVRLLMENISQGILENELFELEGAIQFVKATANEMEKLIQADPYNLNNWIKAIEFYNSIASYDPSYISKAKALIEECMKLNPINQWPYFALADNYVIQKDYVNALRTVQKAVSTDPDNDAIQIKLSLAGILAGKEDVFENAVENIRRIRVSGRKNAVSGNKPVLSTDELLLMAYSANKVENFPKALVFYKEILEISPGDARMHYAMAEIYLKLSDKDSARKEAEKAAELDPDNFKENFNKLFNN